MFNNIFKDKRVLVTGHTGFKGSWLSMWLLKLGAEVAGYSIDIPSTPSHFEEADLASKITHTLGDIRDYEKLYNFCNKFKPEIIFHLAAQPLVRESYEIPKQTFEVNAIGTLNVLECIRNLKDTVKVGIMITSDKCYDNVEWVFGYRETDALGGEDPYSGSKGAAELIARSYMKSFFSNGYPHVATVRAGNVIGGGDWAKDRIIPDIVRSWSKNEPVVIRNPRSTRPWQHVLEPLSGYLTLAADLYTNATNNSESYNFGPDSKVNKNVGEIIKEMQKTWKNAPGWDDQSNAKSLMKESNLLKLNCDKANIILNWYPNLDFETTVKFTADWYSEYYHHGTGIYHLTMSQIDEYIEIAKRNELQWAIM